MALYVNIQINDSVIHTFGAQNISGRTTGVNTYRVCKYVDGKRVYFGVIAHTYEDGAVVLSKKLLDFALAMEGKIWANATRTPYGMNSIPTATLL